MYVCVYLYTYVYKFLCPWPAISLMRSCRQGVYVCVFVCMYICMSVLVSLTGDQLNAVL